MPRIVQFLVDTNLFLQCRRLAELPWGDLASRLCADEGTAFGDHIELLVADAVQAEIDRLKNDGGARRARRARDANALMRSALRNGPTPSFTVLQSTPRVEVILLGSMPSDFVWPDGLDPRKADDRIVAWARALGGNVRVLSQDIGLLLTARRFDIPYVEIPDSWLLAPEPDEHERRIALLEAQLQKLQAAGPVLNVELVRASGVPLERPLVCRAYRCTPFSHEESRALEREILAAHPRAKEPSRPAPSGFAGSIFEWQAPSAKAVERYNADYDTWAADVRSRLESFHSRLNTSSRTIDVVVKLTNTGVRPAERVLIEISAQGSVRLVESSGIVHEFIESTRVDLALTAPPLPPEGRYEPAGLSGMQTALGALAQFRTSPFDGGVPSALRMPEIPVARIARDPNEFYRTPKMLKGSVNELQFECEEFRHGLDAVELSLRLNLLIDEHGDAIQRGVLECRASATNVANPIVLRVPVVIEVHDVAARDVMRGWRTLPTKA